MKPAFPLIPLGAAAGLVLINLIPGRFFPRRDLTMDRRYEISKATVKTLRSLEDPLYIKFYRTPDTPPPYSVENRYVEDLLGEFQAAAGNRLQIDVLSPGNDPESLEELRAAHIATFRFNERLADQFRVRNGFRGLLFRYQDREEAIPFIQDVRYLEHDLSQKIRILLTRKKKVLFFINGHGETTPQLLTNASAGGFLSEYHLETTKLSTSTGLSPDAIFILGPQSPLSLGDFKVLDGYLAEGVPLLVALNRRVPGTSPHFETHLLENPLQNYMAHYGVRWDPDFVLDPECQTMTASSSKTPFSFHFEACPLSTSLNRRHPVTRQLNAVAFPFVHPLVFDSTSSLQMTWLARSSPASRVVAGLVDLEPAHLPPDSVPARPGPFTLAAAVEGSTQTFCRPFRTIDHLRLVVVGTSFFADPKMELPDENILFLQSLAHWLARGDESGLVPPRTTPLRPLHIHSAVARTYVKWFIRFFPVALLLWGTFLYQQMRQLRFGRWKKETLGEGR